MTISPATLSTSARLNLFGMAGITATGVRLGAASLDTGILGEHLGSCQRTHRHWFTLHRLAGDLHGFVAARFVTTMLVVALLIGWLI